MGVALVSSTSAICPPSPATRLGPSRHSFGRSVLRGLQRPRPRPRAPRKPPRATRKPPRSGTPSLATLRKHLWSSWAVCPSSSARHPPSDSPRSVCEPAALRRPRHFIVAVGAARAAGGFCAVPVCGPGKPAVRRPPRCCAAGLSSSRSLSRLPFSGSLRGLAAASTRHFFVAVGAARAAGCFCAASSCVRETGCPSSAVSRGGRLTLRTRSRLSTVQRFWFSTVRVLAVLVIDYITFYVNLSGFLLYGPFVVCTGVRGEFRRSAPQA